MNDETPTRVLSPALSRKLMALWHAAQGAALAAASAQSVAQSTEAQWQSELRTVLDVMDLDPEINWFINWEKGTIGPPPPESQQPSANGHVAFTPGVISDLTGE